MNANDIIEKCARVCDRMVTEHETLGFHAAADIYKNSALQIRALKSTPCLKGGDANDSGARSSRETGTPESSPGVTAGALGVDDALNMATDPVRFMVERMPASSLPAETVREAMVENGQKDAMNTARNLALLCNRLCRRVSKFNPNDDLVKIAGEYLNKTGLLSVFRGGDAAALATADDGWRPIESAPKDGTTILVSFGTRGVHAVAWCEPSGFDHEIWCVDDGKHGPYALRGWNEKPSPKAPTHWRPLPASPKDGR